MFFFAPRCQEGRCPRCGSAYKKVLGGTEVTIRQIEY